MEVRKLELQITANDKGFKVIQKGAKGVNKEITTAGRTSKSVFGGMQKDLLRSVAGFAAVGVAIAVVSKNITASIDASRRFESSFTGIRKTVSGTEEQFRALADGMKELSTEIPINVNELNAIGEAAGQLGIATDDILEFTDTIAKLGVTTNLSADEAATALARFANITGLQSDQFENLGSAIVELGNNLATTEAEIVQFGLRIAGVGTVVGLTEDQILGVGAALSSLGIRAEEGGSAISKVFIEIQKAVELGGEDLENFARVAGVSIEKFAKVFKEDASEGLKLLVKGLGDAEISGMSTLQSLELLGFENIRTTRTLTTLAEGYEKLEDALDISKEGFDAATALTKEAELRFATLDSQLVLTQNKLELLRIEVGDKLAPAFTKAVIKIGDMADSVREGKDPVSEFFTVLKKFTDDPAILQFWKDLAVQMERIPIIGGNISRLDLSNVLKLGLFGGSAAGALKTINTTLDVTHKGLVDLGILAGKATKPVEVLTTNTKRLGFSIMDLDGTSRSATEHVETVIREVKKGKKPVKDLGDGVSGTTKKLTDAEIAIKALTSSLESQIEQTRRAVETFGFNNVELQQYEIDQLNASLATDTHTKATRTLTEELIKQKEALRDLTFDDKFVQSVADFFNEGLIRNLTEGADEAKDALDSLGVFASDVASNINTAFADTLTELVFDFDNFGDAIKNVLKSIANSFFQLIATFATNPLRIALETSLSGGASGGAGGVGSLLGGAGGLGGLGKSFGALGGLFGIGGGGGASIFGATPAILGGGFPVVGTAPLGFLGGLGAAIPAIGAIVAALAIAIPLIMGFLEKTPRLDLDFDQLRDDAGKSLGVAAQVFQLIDEEIFDNEIFNNSVSRQAGLGLKGEIAPVIREAITGQVRIIQEIINRLPSEMAQILNEALLNTAVDIESKVKGDRLLEFDETKKIAEKFKAFIEGDLQARFVFSIREFFIEAFEALGALPDAARQFVEQEFETFQGLNREQRAKFGENFVQEFGAVVDAFNIINGNAPDSLNGTINALKNLADTLGFEAVPSIAQLDAKLEELISAAEFDPSVIADMLALRSAILQVQAAIISSLSSITSALAGLNNSLATAGGTGLDLTGLIQQGLDATLDLLAQEGLSSEDVEALLGQATGFANQLLAEEQRLFNEQQTVLRQASEAQKAGIQAQISSLNEVKTQIQEISRLRLDTLNEELNVAQQLESLFDSITKTLDGIIFSSNSVLTPIEQVSILQSRISSLQAEIQGASGSALAELGKELETALSQLFGSAGDAFGVNSPEFVAIFDQVTTGLADLQDLTEGASRSSEEIQAEIEALQAQTNLELQEVDESINALNDRLASINSQVQENTFVASQALQDTLTFLQGEYVQLFNDRMEQLAEVSNEGFATEILALEAVVDKQQEQIQLEAEQTIVLRSIESLIGNVPRFNEGGFVPPGVNTFAMLHGGREGETVTPGNGNVSISVTVNDVSGNSQGTADFMLNAIARDIRRGGVVSQAIEDRR